MKGKILFAIISILAIEGSLRASCEIDRGSGFKKQDFEIPFPERVGAALSHLSSAEAESIVKSCSAQPDYLDSMRRLERSVAQAALLTPSVLESMKQLNLKFLAWIMRLEELRMTASLHFRPNKALIAKGVDRILKKTFGNCGPNMPGCVGNNPATIREVFSSGNLRERFYLSWNAAIGLLADKFACEKEACGCSATFSKKLSSKEPVDRDIMAFCDTWRRGKNPFSRGRFGKTADDFRRKKGIFDESVSQFHPLELEIPLSEREKKFLSECGPTVDSWKEKLIFNTGIGNFTPLKRSELGVHDPHFPDPHYYYYNAIDLFGFPKAVSISGSTDTLLNLGCILNLSTRTDLEKLRLAAIAYMIPHRHHSIFEIMIASKSFKSVDILPNSDYYKNLFSSEREFEDRTIREYHKMSAHDAKLPTDIYLDCIEKNHKVE
ncbi:MAG: hypothetical protein ABIQ95_12350 [Bdellovibrionia bacterium]